MVSFDSVEKVYPGALGKKSVRALKGVSFSLEGAEVVAYVGPNGAGKTTSLNILMGLHAPTSGRVLIDGKSPQEPKTRASIGYLPERPYFYEQLSAKRFLMLCGRLSGMDRSLLQRRASSLLDELGLADAAHRKLKAFSRGMLQRLGMAQALIHDPDLLVLDEPLGGLDPLGRQLVRRMITDARARGKTVFYSSHILSDAELIADRVAVLAGGKLVKLASLDELTRSTEGKREVSLAPSADLSMEKMQARWPEGTAVGDVWLLTVDEEGLEQFLSQAIADGAYIREVRVAQQTLEDTLVQLIRGSSERGGGE